MRLHCFKCGRELKESDKVVFSEEWDALCHTGCCPVFNEKIPVDRECECCEVLLRRRAAYGPGPPSVVLKSVRG